MEPDLTLNVVTRVKVKPAASTACAWRRSTSRPRWSISAVTVDGRPAEVLQARSRCALNLTRGGNELFLVVPPEPLRAGREYEFEFRHSGNVIHDAGDHVFFVTRPRQLVSHPRLAVRRPTTCPSAMPRDLDLVSAGRRGGGPDRRRVARSRGAAPRRRSASPASTWATTSTPASSAGGYVVDVYANRALEKRAAAADADPVCAPAAHGRRARPRPGGSRRRSLSTPRSAAAADPLGAPADPGRRKWRRRWSSWRRSSVRRRCRASPSRPFRAPSGRASRADLPLHAVLSEAPAARRRAILGRAGAVLRRRAAGARDRAPVVGQPRHRGELSRQLADGGAGQLLRAALPGEEQGRAKAVDTMLESYRIICCSRRTRRARRWIRPARSCWGRVSRARSSRARGATSPTARARGSSTCCGGAWATSDSSRMLAEVAKRYDRKEISHRGVSRPRSAAPAAEVGRPQAGGVLRAMGLSAPAFRR